MMKKPKRETLSTTHTKELFTLTCKLDASNFEHHAREERYSFFAKVIQEHNYETLLTAHHLGDQLEWFLMQLCKDYRTCRDVRHARDRRARKLYHH